VAAEERSGLVGSDRSDREELTGGEIFDRLREWHRELYDAGYVGLTWPKEYGGQGKGHVHNAILQEELVLADAPPTVNGLGIGLCGPALIHHGTEKQKERFLGPMLRADEIWCQGYSEPNAGSDLSGPRRRTSRTGPSVWSGPIRRHRSTAGSVFS
jgi:alkylation response protein AidB-like acyl-CoA dehydrogenase